MIESARAEYFESFVERNAAKQCELLLSSSKKFLSLANNEGLDNTTRAALGYMSISAIKRAQAIKNAAVSGTQQSDSNGNGKAGGGKTNASSGSSPIDPLKNVIISNGRAVLNPTVSLSMSGTKKVLEANAPTKQAINADILLMESKLAEIGILKDISVDRLRKASIYQNTKNMHGAFGMDSISNLGESFMILNSSNIVGRNNLSNNTNKNAFVSSKSSSSNSNNINSYTSSLEIGNIGVNSNTNGARENSIRSNKSDSTKGTSNGSANLTTKSVFDGNSSILLVNKGSESSPYGTSPRDMSSSQFYNDFEYIEKGAAYGNKPDGSSSAKVASTSGFAAQILSWIPSVQLYSSNNNGGTSNISNSNSNNGNSGGGEINGTFSSDSSNWSGSKLTSTSSLNSNSQSQNQSNASSLNSIKNKNSGNNTAINSSSTNSSNNTNNPVAWNIDQSMILSSANVMESSNFSSGTSNTRHSVDQGTQRLLESIKRLYEENNLLNQTVDTLKQQNMSFKKENHDIRLEMDAFKDDYSMRVEKIKMTLSKFAKQYPHEANPANSFLDTSPDKGPVQNSVETSKLQSRLDEMTRVLNSALEDIKKKDRKIKKYEDYYSKIKPEKFSKPAGAGSPSSESDLNLSTKPNSISNNNMNINNSGKSPKNSNSGDSEMSLQQDSSKIKSLSLQSLSPSSSSNSGSNFISPSHNSSTTSSPTSLMGSSWKPSSISTQPRSLHSSTSTLNSSLQRNQNSSRNNV